MKYKKVVICILNPLLLTMMEWWYIKNKDQRFCNLWDGPVGTVKIDVDREPICVPRNATFTVPGNTSKINSGWSYIVEQTEHHNLPNGLVVKSCCITPRARRVTVILINTTDQIIWVRQPLMVTDLFEADVEPEQYYTWMDREGDEIIISFQLVSPYGR